MKLQVLTPDERLFSGDVTSVTIPGTCGEIQIMPGHTYLLTLTCAGQLSYQSPQGDGRFMVAEGHAEVSDDIVTVAVDKVEKE